MFVLSANGNNNSSKQVLVCFITRWQHRPVYGLLCSNCPPFGTSRVCACTQIRAATLW